MNKIRNVLFSIMVILVLANFFTIPLALTQISEDRKGLTGAHSVLTCDMCHDEGVWHTTKKDLTICQTCHVDTWGTVSGSMHSALLFEGEIQGSSGEITVKYCATCHNPHQPDVLRLSYTNGTIVNIPFVEYTELCINCHQL